jgi:hypothetical protein
LPEDTDIEKVSTTTAWRYGFIAPGIFALLNILQWTCLLRRDSLYFLLEKGKEAEALAQFKRIYIFESDADLNTAWERTIADRE